MGIQEGIKRGDAFVSYVMLMKQESDDAPAIKIRKLKWVKMFQQKNEEDPSHRETIGVRQ